MDDLLFAILETLANATNERMERHVLLNSLPSPPRNSSKALEVLEKVFRYVKRPHDFSGYELTCEGRAAYLSENQRRNENAKRYSDECAKNLKAERNLKKQFRHDFFITAFTVLLTLFVERLPQIIDAIAPFLSRFFDLISSPFN